jgi:hypothetical protein
MSTRNNRDRDHLAKKPRTGERTLLACIHCKQRKLKVLFLSSLEHTPLSVLDALRTNMSNVSQLSATLKAHNARIACELNEVWRLADKYSIYDSQQ